MILRVFVVDSFNGFLLMLVILNEMRVRLIIQDHIAAVHECSVAWNRLKRTSDSLEGRECH